MTEVKDWRKNPRVSRNALPNVPTPCAMRECLHNVNIAPEGATFEHWQCPAPRVNKQHADAKCHKVGNKNFAAFIEPQ